MTESEFLRASELHGMERASTFAMGFIAGFASLALVGMIWLVV